MRVIVAISAGGILGSLARYALGVAFPHLGDEFGWATFAINVTGCFLIGVLTVLVTELWPGRPLLRPFLGIGFLGGYTTFSAYIVDILQALRAGAVGVAFAYLAGTAVAALIAVWLASTVTRWLIQPRGSST